MGASPTKLLPVVTPVSRKSAYSQFGDLRASPIWFTDAAQSGFQPGQSRRQGQWPLPAGLWSSRGENRNGTPWRIGAPLLAFPAEPTFVFRIKDDRGHKDLGLRGKSRRQAASERQFWRLKRRHPGPAVRP